MIQTTSDIKGNKVVVIGASSGIGFAIAKRAAHSGAQVIIASSNQDKLNAALAKLPDGTKGYQLDANNENAVQKFFEGIGAFNHLVYTAGENLRLNSIRDTVIDDNKQFFNTRYWGAVLAVKHAAGYVKESIVLTGGNAGARPGAGWSLASSICCAMEGFTRALSIELAPVRVNLVAPGIVKTPLWNGFSEEDREAMYKDYAEKLPVGFVAEADDIAKTYIYLMEQKYATGQVAIVDGGGVLV